MAATHLALEALGDGTRRAIFELLRPGPRSVGEIAAEVPVSRPAVSQHLRVLKEAGLVRDHAEGTRRIYEIDAGSLHDLRRYFDDLWESVLAAYARGADRQKGPNP